mmetsp:Transcript_39146/g.92303  ORF Transcript_39146/g.92303 Transcript_39146/m.92303 type:complete len:111 (+) Transcript_39146:282-614(+)
MTVPATVLRAAFPGVWVWELHKVNLIDSAANEGTGVWQIGSEVGLVSHSKDFSVEFHGQVNVLHQYSCMLHLAIIYSCLFCCCPPCCRAKPRASCWSDKGRGALDRCECT